MPHSESPAPADDRPGFARRHRKLLITLAVVVAVLVAARIALEPVIERYARGVLNSTPGWGGALADLDLQLLRGGAKVEGLVVQTTTGEDSTPLLDAPRVDVRIRWSALFRKGELVGEAILHRPVIRYDVVAKPPPEPDTPEQEGEVAVDDVWQEKVKEMLPFTIDRIVVRDAEVRIVDRAKNLDVSTSRLDGLITNLTNVEGEAGAQVADIVFTGETIGGASLDLRGTIDPFAADPTFDIDLKLEGMDLTALNELVRAYSGVDIERGRMDLYGEMTAKDAQLTGYIKPLISELNVADLREEAKDGGVVRAVKEAVVGAAAEILENQGEEQQGARIDLSGPLDAPSPNLIGAIGSVLRNAFVSALKPGLEGEA